MFFIFLPYDGGVCFFRPLVGGGVKIQLKKIIKYIKLHLNTWGPNVFPMLRKIEELVSPPTYACIGGLHFVDRPRVEP